MIVSQICFWFAAGCLCFGFIRALPHMESLDEVAILVGLLALFLGFIAYLLHIVREESTETDVY